MQVRTGGWAKRVKSTLVDGKAASWTSICIASCCQTQKGSFHHASIMGACSFSRVNMDVKFMQLHPSFKLVMSLWALRLWSHTAVPCTKTSLPTSLCACHRGYFPAEVLAHYLVFCNPSFFQALMPRIHHCSHASCLCMISADLPVSLGEKSMSSLIKKKTLLKAKDLQAGSTT